MTERTIDPDSLATREDFARHLARLREQRGLTVRDVAASADAPVATVGGYLSGRHLPPLAAMSQFLRVLSVLGVAGDDVDAWVSVVHRLRRAPGPRPADSPAPYRGLAPYEPQDAAIFVGREQLTSDLVERISAFPAHPIVVIGPSGSGKSSLLRAGVVAALRHQDDVVVLAAPTTLGDGARQAEAGSVLVVDQIEEVLGGDEAGAGRLVSELAGASARGVAVVIALRSDFFDQALAIEPFPSWVAQGLVVVPPLGAEDLRRVVLEPARAVGIAVEPALVDVLVAEAGEGAGPDRLLDSGALPLVSHALWVTWKSSPGHRLTLDHYREAGGFRGAVAKTAEEVYAALSPEQQDAAHRTLLRLVQVREGAADTRRPADPHEFTDDAATQVLDACVAARLVTRDLGRVQLAHEALIVAWPRLRRWLEENRQALYVRGQLTEAVGRWRASERSPDLLYRGTALESVDGLAAGGAGVLTLTEPEHEFLEASRDAERMRRAARRRTTQRLRALAGSLAAVAVAAGGLAIAAWNQSRVLGTERDLAVSRQLAVTSRYLAGTDPGLAAQVAVAADAAADTVEGRSALLSASAVTAVSVVGEAAAIVNCLVVGGDGAWVAAGTEASGVEIWTARSPTRALTSLAVGTSPVYAVTTTPDGRVLLAGGGDQVLRAWDLTDPSTPEPVVVQGDAVGATVYGIAVDPTGERVAAALSDGTVHLWRAGPEGLEPLSTVSVFEGTVQSVAFVGSTLAAGGSEGLLALIDLTDPAAPNLIGTPVQGADGQITDLDLAPDGHTLAASSYDYTVHLWDVTDPSAPLAGAILTGPATWVNGVDFSADGSTLAGASSDKRLWTWNVATGLATRSLPDPASLIAVAWGPTGSELYAGGGDAAVRVWSFPGSVVVGLGSVPAQVPVEDGVMVTATRDGLRVWDASDPEEPRLLSLTAAPEGERLDGALAYSAPLGWAIAGTRGGSAFVWDINDPAAPVLLGALAAHSTWIELVDVDESGTRLALCSDDGAISLWDLSEGIPDGPAAVIPDPGEMVYAAEFSPDGTMLVAAALTANEVRLYDVSDLTAPRQLGEPLVGPEGYVYSAVFSPDGRMVAASGGDGSWWLWDVSTAASPTVVAGPMVWAEGYSRALEFSPDGSRLAEAMTDGTVRLWDVSDPAAPRRDAVLEGVSGTVYGVAYWPDGRHLSAAGADRTVRIFNTSLDDASAEVCAAATRGVPMSRSDWSRVAGSLPFPSMCT